MEANTLSAFAELLNHRTLPNNTSVKTPFAQGIEQGKRVDCPTILDLRSHDRFRILKLIEELLDAQEEADKLRQKQDDEKALFQEKRSTLIKKLDILSERNEKAQAEIDHLRKRHQSSLVKLEKKVSTVSLKLEASLAEIQTLRMANLELKKENLDLRRLNNEATAAVTAIQQENSLLNPPVGANKLKDRRFNIELQHFGTTDKMALTGNKNHEELRDLYRASLLYPLEQLRGVVGQEKNNRPPKSYLPSTTEGAGDFNRTSSIGLNTIKAPPGKLEHDKCTESTLAFRISSKSDTLAVNQEPIGPSENESSDMALLENLFFRF